MVNVAFATPKQIEVWFLSVDNTTYLDPHFKFSKQIAQNNLQCQPMGDYCFDPQVGLYKKGDESETLQEIDQSEVDKSEEYKFLDSHKGADRKKIDCDKDTHFLDVFCGKSKNSNLSKQAKLEVWVDISSTMKQVDFQGFDKQCHREHFLRSLSGSCTKDGQLNIYFFEEYRKQAGMLDRVCLSGGLNEMKNIVNDLKRSKAEHVLIITDIFEAQDSFINAIEALGPTKIRGINKPLYASMIKKELSRYRKLCK